jgi:hypothetical protein
MWVLWMYYCSGSSAGLIRRVDRCELLKTLVWSRLESFVLLILGYSAVFSSWGAAMISAKCLHQDSRFVCWFRCLFGTSISDLNKIAETPVEFKDLKLIDQLQACMLSNTGPCTIPAGIKLINSLFKSHGCNWMTAANHWQWSFASSVVSPKRGFQVFNQ